ncbi:hypothetical protein [Paenibacillus kandeliae]|uniref:hypothetical protein n=1 Tax=Paenibacillus kandeliae TaxID=3231269 RepID=UPI00345A142F
MGMWALVSFLLGYIMCIMLIRRGFSMTVFICMLFYSGFSGFYVQDLLDKNGVNNSGTWSNAYMVISLISFFAYNQFLIWKSNKEQVEDEELAHLGAWAAHVERDRRNKNKKWYQFW